MFPPSLELLDCNDLFNLLNAEINGLARISDPNYIYLLDCRSQKNYDESHIITAHHVRRNHNREFLLPHNANLATREHIVLYDDRTQTLPLSDQDDIYECAKLLHQHSSGLSTVMIVRGGYQLFSKLYPFLRTQQTLFSPRELESIQTYPNEIYPAFIYLGRREHALNSKIMKDLKIRAYVNCTKHNDYLVQGNDPLKYYQIPIDDTYSVPNMAELLHNAVNFIAIAYDRKEPILIYSDRGISRSAAVVVAFISFHMQLNSQEALRYVEDRRTIYPQQSFIECIDSLNEKLQELRETILNMKHTVVEKDDESSNEHVENVMNGASKTISTMNKKDGTSVEITSAKSTQKALASPSENIQRKRHQYFMEILGVPAHRWSAPSVNVNIEKEESENILEAITIKKHGQEWLNIRHNDLVYEDHFNPSIMKMAKQVNFSYEQLLSACRTYEQQENFEDHQQCSEKNFPFFVKKKLSEDDARAAAFAIAFYTGSKSNGVISRSASLVVRTSNGEAFQNINEGNLKEAATILYYLVKALSNIPYYWGVCARSVDLTDDALNTYKVGSLITWLQFSSSKKGYDPPEFFSNRNTYFIIYSLTGRQIKQFSMFPEEDEVLFLPHSTFLVLDHKKNANQHVIYLRQVELGFCQWSVLWVDDHIFDLEWENKGHMERASTRSLNLNVHFIPKSHTDYALAFLRSPFGQRLKNRSTFRIVTDMRRDNEPSPDNAGLRFIKEVRKMGFQNDCLIFTYYKASAFEKVQNELAPSENKNVFVADDNDALDRFVGFE